MKLSISNIAWSPQVDDEMYRFLQEAGYSGIEIAPTRLFPDAPYDHCGEAQAFVCLAERDIWFGCFFYAVNMVWKKRKVVRYC